MTSAARSNGQVGFKTSPQLTSPESQRPRLDATLVRVDGGADGGAPP